MKKQLLHKSKIQQKTSYIENQWIAMRQSLEHVQAELNGTIVSELLISNNQIIASLRYPRIRLLLNPLDKRSCALESINFGEYEPIDWATIIGLMRYIKSVGNEGIFF